MAVSTSKLFIHNHSVIVRYKTRSVNKALLNKARRKQ